ncbi:hypothetical protein Pedsa_3658 [Pseudopedobacter saltans DSM 12145]|uniref:Uncharacterized protein n=1 Tax=Pseudopedobacter saltans (strain ATCC 51119 / DSM 12145 / JCM 21818 / CCUG 39354 / LMG 10337 / NBRC 100064 / NCIMB 13643) TaxID=762903 RepID=F0S5L3_PSESL|nr:hypothetical protein [Pseudopedobacter saltans]ADY54187.1 hypothetical protein Pedsa_3658 [Pseudopedobacter saltans DSM 12145]
MTRFKLYRHFIAIALLLIAGFRFGKTRGMLLVIVIYLALNVGSIVTLIRKIKYGKF